VPDAFLLTAAMALREELLHERLSLAPDLLRISVCLAQLFVDQRLGVVGIEHVICAIARSARRCASGSFVGFFDISCLQASSLQAPRRWYVLRRSARWARRAHLLRRAVHGVEHQRDELGDERTTANARSDHREGRPCALLRDHRLFGRRGVIDERLCVGEPRSTVRFVRPKVDEEAVQDAAEGSTKLGVLLDPAS
jgi:hypothetical protein